MTSTEQHYPQIEKEALAITWALRDSEITLLVKTSVLRQITVPCYSSEDKAAR